MDYSEAGHSDPIVIHRFRQFALAVAAVSMAVASLVLLGWALDVGALKAMLPGHIDMKANTALAMLLMGLALLACQWQAQARRRLAGMLSLVAGLLGAVTLVQYTWGVDLGIDTMWFDDPASREAGRPPGRMSQVSAIAFMLLGGAGIASCQLRWVRLSQGLLLAVIAIALFALSVLGYHGLERGVKLPFNPVAVHTAVMLMLLALGWLAARPDVGVMRVLSARSAGGSVARRALLPSLLLPSLLSYVAQVMQSRGWLSPDGTITLLAVASGGLVGWIIWSVSVLLDRVEREKRITTHLREDASTDELTQLGNRRAFQAAVKGLLHGGRDHDAVFSLLMLDLDHFKSFNDSFGHVAGDQALRQVGQLLKAALRPGDVAARYGGEEFAVLLPGIDRERARLVAERIRRDFHAAPWPDRAITVSIGAAQCQPGDDEETLVARADRALYAAKAAGRNRVVTDGALPPDEPAPLQATLL